MASYSNKVRMAIHAEDRATLIRMIKGIVKKPSGDVPILEINCSCKRKSYYYQTIKDIPKKSVICPCGDYVIKYGKIEDD